MTHPMNSTERAVRWALLIAFAAWTPKFVFASGAAAVTGSFLHKVDLVFHEAGHVLFSPFGQFLTVLGGSLLQVLIPILCAIALIRTSGDRVGAAICAWWAGQNLIDLAPYIGDARALQLPLLGGKTGAEVEGHDWEWLLTRLGWLQHDRALAAAAHAIGSIVMIAAIAWGVIELLRAPARENP